MVVVQKTEGSTQTEEVETKEGSLQTEVISEEWERKKKMENKAFGEYIGRLEKRLKEKDTEIKRGAHEGEEDGGVRSGRKLWVRRVRRDVEEKEGVTREEEDQKRSMQTG